MKPSSSNEHLQQLPGRMQQARRWRYAFGMVAMIGVMVFIYAASSSFGGDGHMSYIATVSSTNAAPPLPSIGFDSPILEDGTFGNGSALAATNSNSDNNSGSGKDKKKSVSNKIKREAGDGPFTEEAPFHGLWPVVNTSCEWKRPNPPVVIFNRVPKCASTTTLELFQKMATGKLDMPLPHASLIPKKANYSHYVYPTYPDGLPKNMTQAHTRSLFYHFARRDGSDLFTRNTVKALAKWLHGYAANKHPNGPVKPLVYSRHLLYLNFALVPPKKTVTWINVVREPVSRTYSDYYYYLYSPRRKKSERIRKIRTAIGPFSSQIPNKSFITLEQCVGVRLAAGSKYSRHLRSCRVRNRITRFLCGQASICGDGDSWHAFALAKRHVDDHYAAIGTMEDYALSLRLFEHVLPNVFSGISHAYQQMDRDANHNKAKEYKKAMKKKKKSTPPAAVTAAIKRALRYDIAMYKHIVKKMREKLQQCGLPDVVNTPH